MQSWEWAAPSDGAPSLATEQPRRGTPQGVGRRHEPSAGGNGGHMATSSLGRPPICHCKFGWRGADQGTVLWLTDHRDWACL